MSLPSGCLGTGWYLEKRLEMGTGLEPVAFSVGSFV